MDYSYVIIPLIVLITAQVLKLLTDGIKGNFDLRNLFISYGGMPSSHTAFAMAITTLVGLRLGFDDPSFAIALVFTLLVMRDATSFRRILGQQGKAFNRLVKNLPEAERKDMPHFREQMGHSALEVTAGAIWGIAITYFLVLL